LEGRPQKASRFLRDKFCLQSAKDFALDDGAGEKLEIAIGAMSLKARPEEVPWLNISVCLKIWYFTSKSIDIIIPIRLETWGIFHIFRHPFALKRTASRVASLVHSAQEKLQNFGETTSAA
jgi:hypothetical protein